MRWARTGWAQWPVRFLVGVVASAPIYGALLLSGTDPDMVRVVLLVATCVVALGLVLDVASVDSPSWVVPVEAAARHGSADPRLGRHVALLESHLSARTRDAFLQDRLGVLTDRILRQRHGIGRDDPGAAELLGPGLVTVLDGPVRRLSTSEIDHCLTAIEEL